MSKQQIIDLGIDSPETEKSVRYIKKFTWFPIIDKTKDRIVWLEECFIKEYRYRGDEDYYFDYVVVKHDDEYSIPHQKLFKDKVMGIINDN